jgi:microcystin degradation protein MlrC
VRIGVARFSQETNSFSPVVTDLAAFERAGVRVGAEFDLSFDWQRSGIGSFVRAASARADAELIPLMYASAGPGGTVTREAFEHLSGLLLRQVRNSSPLDAIYLNLHGAMAAEHEDDPEGVLLEMVRAEVGKSTLVAAYTDHHACITGRKVASADIIVGHRTQPHDHPATGAETARVLFRIVDEGIRPTVAMRKAPMITHQEQYLTRKPPMKDWFDLAREIETRPGVISVSTYPMQPWLDVEEGGWASIVYTDDDPELADELAKELTREVWSLRHDLMKLDSIPVSEAVSRADAAPRGIVVLSDTGDSVAGGSAGDSVTILAEMIRQRVRGTALVPLVDEPAALAAAEAGEGAVLELRLGRAADSRWGDPVTAEVEVVKVTDGAMPSVPGLEAHSQGTSALVRTGNVLIGLSRHRNRGAMHPEFWQHFGLDATDRNAVQMVVVKTASNFQYFADWTEELIRVDTPGHTQSRVTDFDWRRLPRPIFPLDADAALDFD